LIGHDHDPKCYFYQITLRKRRFKGIRFYAKIRTCYFFLYNKNDTYRFCEKKWSDEMARLIDDLFKHQKFIPDADEPNLVFRKLGTPIHTKRVFSMTHFERSSP
jgi:hypothetical protein